MDTGKFDAVARLFGNGMTRREALRGLVAGAVAVTAGGAVHAGQAASPKLRRRRKHRKQRRLNTHDTSLLAVYQSAMRAELRRLLRDIRGEFRGLPENAS